MNQILWFEIFYKGLIGIALLTIPVAAARTVGLPRPNSGFWPRLVGTLSLALAFGVLVGTTFPDARGGLGPSSLIAINLVGVAGLVAPLVLGAGPATRRGRIFIILNAILLGILAFLEIAHV